MNKLLGSLKKIKKLILTEVWGPLALMFIVPALLNLSVPGLRSLDYYFSLLLGSFVVTSWILWFVIYFFLGIVNIDFTIPVKYGNLFTIVANLILISIFAFLIYRKYESREHGRCKLLINSFLWSSLIIQTIGGIMMVIVGQLPWP